jgi:hypothetical protein
MYIQPTQNALWKYRHKSVRRNPARTGETVRIGIPQSRPDQSIYSMGQAAEQLGISSRLLPWRISSGKYPDAPRGNGDRREFTSEHSGDSGGMRQSPISVRPADADRVSELPAEVSVPNKSFIDAAKETVGIWARWIS